jgi:hypothetical protein
MKLSFFLVKRLTIRLFSPSCVWGFGQVVDEKREKTESWLSKRGSAALQGPKQAGKPAASGPRGQHKVDAQDSFLRFFSFSFFVFVSSFVFVEIELGLK